MNNKKNIDVKESIARAVTFVSSTSRGYKAKATKIGTLPINRTNVIIVEPFSK
jgi:hypothetical protein